MTDPRLRRLLIAVLTGAAIAGVVAGLLVLAGFGVRVDLTVAIGAVSGAVIWFFHSVVVLPDDASEPEPVERRGTASVGLDRRTRVLESQLRGAQTGLAMTVGALHETIAHLARERAGDGPYPPALGAYLRSAPRPLSRTQLRTILRELTAL